MRKLILSVCSLVLLLTIFLNETISIANSELVSPQNNTRYVPPGKYPLGIASVSNVVAGGTLTFDATSNYIQNGSVNGQIIAKHLAIGDPKNLDNIYVSTAHFQDYSADPYRTNLDISDIGTPVLIGNLVGASTINAFVNSINGMHNFYYDDTQRLTYFIENPPTDAEIDAAVPAYLGSKVEDFKSLLSSKDKFLENDLFTLNHITSFDDAQLNIEQISAYYAGLTSKAEVAKYNDAVAEVEVNTEAEIIQNESWGTAKTLQINIRLDPDKKKTVTPFVIIDADKANTNISGSHAISINLVNFDPENDPFPYVFINYKHLSDFPFAGGSYQHFTAYRSQADVDYYQFEGNQGVSFYERYRSDAIPLIANPNNNFLGGTEAEKDMGYQIASRVVHNFSDLTNEISISSPASYFIGTILAPYGDIKVDQNNGNIVGSLISGRNVTINKAFSAEEGYRSSFDRGSFPGTDDLDIPDEIFRGDIQSIRFNDSLLQSFELDAENVFFNYEAQLNSSNPLPGVAILDEAEWNNQLTIHTSEAYSLWYQVNDEEWTNYHDEQGRTSFTEEQLILNKASDLFKSHGSYQDSLTHVADFHDDSTKKVGETLAKDNSIRFKVAPANASLSEAESDLYPAKGYQFRLLGNLTLEYPAAFTLDTFTLNSGITEVQTQLEAKVDNPFGVSWTLGILPKNAEQNLNNPFEQDNRLSYRMAPSNAESEWLPFEKERFIITTSNELSKSVLLQIKLATSIDDPVGTYPFSFGWSIETKI